MSGRGGEEMEKVTYLSEVDSLTVEISPNDGSWETAQEIIKKICEANKECTLRIEVKNVSR